MLEDLFYEVWVSYSDLYYGMLVVVLYMLIEFWGLFGDDYVVWLFGICVEYGFDFVLFGKECECLVVYWDIFVV